jgi:hypothetical protein
MILEVYVSRKGEQKLHAKKSDADGIDDDFDDNDVGLQPNEVREKEGHWHANDQEPIIGRKKMPYQKIWPGDSV